MQSKHRSYTRRFCSPLFPEIPKTTTPVGRKEYDRLYKRMMRGAPLLVDNEPVKRRGMF